MLEKLKHILRIEPQEKTPNISEKIDNLFSFLDEETIRIEIGDDIVPFNKNVCKTIDNVRQELTEELGFILPVVRILNNIYLQENEYTIKIENNLMHNGFVVPNEEGIEEEIYENLKNVLLNNMHMLLTNELTEKYIESVRSKNSIMVWDITGAISTTEIRIILGDLLEKGKSIKNISKIFEKISEQIYVQNRNDYRNPHKLAEEIVKQLY